MVITHLSEFFFGGREWKHTVANVGIRLFELLTKRAAPNEQGMVAGGVFWPIPSETPLGLTRHHPYDPLCNFKHGRNPIFAKVMAILNELSAKSGMIGLKELVIRQTCS